jgi:hypothetical protein
MSSGDEEESTTSRELRRLDSPFFLAKVELLATLQQGAGDLSGRAGVGSLSSNCNQLGRQTFFACPFGDAWLKAAALSLTRNQPVARKAKSATR